MFLEIFNKEYGMCRSGACGQLPAVAQTGNQSQMLGSISAQQLQLIQREMASNIGGKLAWDIKLIGNNNMVTY
jgi:hypothetical protein